MKARVSPDPPPVRVVPDVHLSPEGVPQAGWAFAPFSPYPTVESWRAQYTPFGRRLSLTPSPATPPPPPMRFVGQIELPSSDASWWNGSTMFVSREPLVLNSWRVYDPRVGQYLQPEPVVSLGTAPATSIYGYSRLAPLDYYDPDGLFPAPVRAHPPRPGEDSITARCRARPWECAFIFELFRSGARGLGRYAPESAGPDSTPWLSDPERPGGYREPAYPAGYTPGGECLPAPEPTGLPGGGDGGDGPCTNTGVNQLGQCMFECLWNGTRTDVSAYCSAGCPAEIQVWQAFADVGCDIVGGGNLGGAGI